MENAEVALRLRRPHVSDACCVDSSGVAKVLDAMRNIDLDSLQIIKTVAAEGGISRAAAKLHRVQSNVTTRVKQLEARLGTQLFVRRKRSPVLSPDGKRQLSYAHRLLDLSREAQAALEALCAEPKKAERRRTR